MYELIDLSATHFPDQYGQALLKAGCPADRAALADPAMLAAMIEAARRCFDQGAEGLIADARLLYAAWPFQLAAIHRPVHLWQGTADTLVPYAVNKPVAEALPQCIWHEVPDAGHFVAISHARPILEHAAEDLAAA
jgi:pimeloyl-ACP methyl ester carboxylesterase